MGSIEVISGFFLKEMAAIVVDVEGG